nr:hypothetical protein [uncultured bacterium]
MKIAIVIVRVLFGLLLLFGSIVFLFNLFPQPELQGDVKIYMDGIMKVQMMPIVKVIELLCGLAFVIGRYVALANVVILPIMLNVFLFHLFLGPEQLATAVVVLLANLFLLYAYRKHYTGVFATRRIA